MAGVFEKVEKISKRMTPTLRKAHRITWFTLALVLPIAWLAAIWVIPDAVFQDPLRPAQPDALAALVRSKETHDLRFSLRQDASGTKQQLEVLILKPLEQANATLVLESNPEIALGQLGARGVWRFALESPTGTTDSLRLRVEDRIRQTVICRVVF